MTWRFAQFVLRDTIAVLLNTSVDLLAALLADRLPPGCGATRTGNAASGAALARS